MDCVARVVKMTVTTKDDTTQIVNRRLCNMKGRDHTRRDLTAPGRSSRYRTSGISCFSGVFFGRDRPTESSRAPTVGLIQPLLRSV